jgi:hypothetical protein
MCRDARLCYGSRSGHGREREIDRLMDELPDRRDSTQDENTVCDHLKQTALFFFRSREQSVSRFVDFVVCLACIHKNSLVAVFPYCNARARKKNNDVTYS